MDDIAINAVCDPGTTVLNPPPPKTPTPEKAGKLISIQPGQHENMGKIIRDWVRGDKPIPTTLAELRCQLEVEPGHVVAKVSDALISFRFVQPLIYGEYIIPLPHIDELETAILEVESTSNYDLPPFYAEHISGGGLTPEELLWSRVGDYTIASCM